MSTARIRQQVTHPRGRGGGLASAGLRRQPRLPERPGLAGGTAAELGRGMGPAPSRPSVPPFSVAFRAEGATRHWPPPSSRDPTPDAGIDPPLPAGPGAGTGPLSGESTAAPRRLPAPKPGGCVNFPGAARVLTGSGAVGVLGSPVEAGSQLSGELLIPKC